MSRIDVRSEEVTVWKVSADIYAPTTVSGESVGEAFAAVAKAIEAGADPYDIEEYCGILAKTRGVK